MNYSQVSSNIQAWMENDDTEFTAIVDTIIELAELRVYRDVDLYNTHKKTSGTAFSTSVATITVPSDLLAIRYFTVTNASGVETNLDPKDESFVRVFNQSATGLPRVYSFLSDTTIEVAPVPDSTYSYVIGYKYRPTALSSGNTTTWLSTNAPDVLLYACFLESVQFMKGEPDDLANWSNGYAQAIERLKREEEQRNRLIDDRYQEPHGNR